MNAPHKPQVAPHRSPADQRDVPAHSEVTVQPNPCPECAGEGTVLEVRRISGEAFDADYCEVECDYCDGTGEVEPDEYEPLTEVTLKDNGDGWRLEA